MRAHWIFSRIAVGMLALAAVAAQEAAPRRDAKKGDFARFPMGVLGGTAEVLADRSSIEVLSVQEGAPAHRAGLRKGDLIVAINGDAPPVHTRDINSLAGPMKTLGDAILAGYEGPRLALAVRRGEARLDLKVRAKKELEFTGGVIRDLLRTRRKNGSWKANTGEDASRYTTALCGLAILAHGDPVHRPALAKIAAYLAGPKRRAHLGETLLEPAGLSNWFLTMSGIYLAEYVIATGEEQWLPTIQLLCDALAARQTEQGRYGHGITVGYGGKGLNIINTHAHLMWALAERAGCKIDEGAWRRSLAEVKKSTGENGGVRYWTLNTGYWDACARTGQMALALSLRGEEPELAARMAGYLDRHSARMREAHATGSIGMIFGTAALRRVNDEGWERHMKTWRWYGGLMLQPDGSAGYVGGKRNNGGDHYLGKQHIANAIAGTMIACRSKNLHIFGNDERGWLARLKVTPAAPSLQIPDGEDPERWTDAMDAFGQLEEQEPSPTPGAAIFVGSSSIRLWDTLAKDMTPFPVVQRGFGGSKLFDACYWANQLLAPHPAPSCVVVFSGTNDIRGKQPKSAAQVHDYFELLVRTARDIHPNTPICYLAITPTLARAEHRAIVDDANALVRATCEADPRLEFIDPVPDLLDAAGLPDARFFAADRLHLNAAGYRIWTKHVLPVVAQHSAKAKARADRAGRPK